MPISSEKEERFRRDLLAGMMAGGICGLLFQPLDVIKTNLIILPAGYDMKGKHFYQPLFDISTLIMNKSGWKGFWMGTTPAALRASLSCGIYFSLLRLFDSWSFKRISKRNRVFTDFFDSGIARMTTSLLTNPLNILKTQWALIGEKQENHRFFSSLKSLFKNNQGKLFVMGTLPMMMEEFLFGGIFNAIYEKLNRTEHLANRVHKYWLAFCNGLVAGSIGSVLTQPFEIARIKIQSQKTHWHPAGGGNLMIGAWVYIYKRYGFRGFLRGFYPRFIKKTLVSATTFSLYEFVRKRELDND